MRPLQRGKSPPICQIKKIAKGKGGGSCLGAVTKLLGKEKKKKTVSGIFLKEEMVSEKEGDITEPLAKQGYKRDI